MFVGSSTQSTAPNNCSTANVSAYPTNPPRKTLATCEAFGEIRIDEVAAPLVPSYKIEAPIAVGFDHVHPPIEAFTKAEFNNSNSEVKKIIILLSIFISLL